ncbi:hypothetical protein L2E82_47070 [Cichorium intybus]|uniref:Uncharacterized protein n=1 Tax=Cichorium intybus TaxID=13427 RepID=A0ACB8YUI8_CICIN|nr:hypothetical protein L2E82_47070 [Cichorium intybus]
MVAAVLQHLQLGLNLYITSRRTSTSATWAAASPPCVTVRLFVVQSDKDQSVNSVKKKGDAEGGPARFTYHKDPRYCGSIL